MPLNRCIDSPTIKVVTLKDYESPKQVQGLNVESATGSYITLSWLPATDNVAVTKYVVYRDNELLADNITDTRYVDTTPKKNRAYEYTVSAFDKNGNESIISESVTAETVMTQITKITPDDLAIIGKDEVELKVLFSSRGNSSKNKVEIAYYDEKQKEWKAITPTPLGQAVYDKENYYASYKWDISDFKEEKNIDVRFRVTDVDGNYEDETVSYLLDRTPPKPPKDVKVTQNAGTLTIRWDNSHDADIHGVFVMRQKEGEEKFEKIAQIEDNTIS